MNSLITLAKQRGYLTEVAVCCVADRRRWICQRNELTAREIPAGAGTAAEWGDTPPRYDPKTGKRVIALALRNKDAVLLGQGGPEAGDICYWNAEGYNYDHGDSLATCYGSEETSSSPIFIGAGPGLKQGYYTDRIIRQIDFAPTIAAILGVRMPAQCEGAPVYQILAQEF